MKEFLEKLRYKFELQQEGWMQNMVPYAYKGIRPSHLDDRLHHNNSITTLFTKELKAKLLSL